jgi:peptidoglycan/xylan/chitin deacetylase (PgdA/CDA1 family)
VFLGPMLPFPSMIGVVRRILVALDNEIDYCYLRLRRECSSLIVFYGHGLLLSGSENEASQKVLYPGSQKGLTVCHIRSFIEYFLNSGYKFISPKNILDGLRSDENYIMLTFDDGYFNNIRIIPILKEYSVPATVFVSTDNVIEGKGFWWDVVYRERTKTGTQSNKIDREIGFLKSRRANEIEKHIVEHFGDAALKPIGDLDRPFTPKELEEFAREKYVHVGNHTKSHGVLKNYQFSEAESQINGCQDAMYSMTGTKPLIIAYPSGEYSAEIIRISRNSGLRLGFTVEHKKNRLPLDLKSDIHMIIGRYGLDGRVDVVAQCQNARSDIGLMKMFRFCKKKFTE